MHALYEPPRISSATTTHGATHDATHGATHGTPGTQRTLPKTTCFPSSHAVFAVQRKNWEPLVPGPAFAIESTPGLPAAQGGACVRRRSEPEVGRGPSTHVNRDQVRAHGRVMVT